MPSNEIEEFGKLLVRQVRDRTIEECDMLLNPKGNSPRAKRWRELGYERPLEELVKAVIMDCVDVTAFYLLEAIDSGALRLLFLSTSGHQVDLTKDGLGELGGWYAGGDEWVARYSQQRFVDYLKDVDLE